MEKDMMTGTKLRIDEGMFSQIMRTMCICQILDTQLLTAELKLEVTSTQWSDTVHTSLQQAKIKPSLYRSCKFWQNKKKMTLKAMWSTFDSLGA